MPTPLLVVVLAWLPLWTRSGEVSPTWSTPASTSPSAALGRITWPSSTSPLEFRLSPTRSTPAPTSPSATVKRITLPSGTSPLELRWSSTLFFSCPAAPHEQWRAPSGSQGGEPHEQWLPSLTSGAQGGEPLAAGPARLGRSSLFFAVGVSSCCIGVCARWSADALFNLLHPAPTGSGLLFFLQSVKPEVCACPKKNN